MLTAEHKAALLKVKEQKLANPHTLIMHTYLEETELYPRSCIAGQLILNKYGLDNLRETSEISFNCHSLASSILGMPLTKEEIEGDKSPETDKMFYLSCWSETLIDSWDDTEEYSLERAIIVAKVIDEFIAQHYKEEENP